MVFKQAVIEERLAFLREAVTRLKELQSIRYDDFLRQGDKQWAIEHGLHLCAEAIFDIGNHILVGRFGQRAEGYDNILQILAQKQVVSPMLAERFERLGGFRNILVHEYLTVDLRKVYDRLQNGLADFEAFAAEILQWLQQGVSQG